MGNSRVISFFFLSLSFISTTASHPSDHLLPFLPSSFFLSLPHTLRPFVPPCTSIHPLPSSLVPPLRSHSLLTCLRDERKLKMSIFPPHHDRLTSVSHPALHPPPDSLVSLGVTQGRTPSTSTPPTDCSGGHSRESTESCCWPGRRVWHESCFTICLLSLLLVGWLTPWLAAFRSG